MANQCFGEPADQDVSSARMIALNSRLEALREITDRARSRDSVEELASVISKRWRFCADVQRWRLLYRNGDAFSLISSDASGCTVQESYSPDRDEQRFWDQRKPVMLTREQIEREYPALARSFDCAGAAQLMVLPRVVASKNQYYLLFAASSEKGFDKLDRKFIESVSSVLVDELSHMQSMHGLIRSLEEQATQDPLTGMPNRRHFTTMLDRLWRNAARQGQPVSMLMLDVDHFKKYNDVFGHLAGDECLRLISSAIQEVVRRPLDVCARLGGEEFAVLLPDTPEAGATLIAERILEAVQQRAIPHVIDGVAATVSLSIGCATFLPKRGDDQTSLIEAADIALYQAKRAGRRQLKCFAA